MWLENIDFHRSKTMFIITYNRVAIPVCYTYILRVFSHLLTDRTQKEKYNYNYPMISVKTSVLECTQAL